MVPRCREWDEQVINVCMHPHDAEQVLRIRLSDRIQDDHIAWALERTRLFSVKSAYRLALELDRDKEEQVGSSLRPDGTRLMYNDLWTAPIPQKVRIFAWRLAQESLATQINRKKQSLEENGRCQICAREDESGNHTVVSCTKAAGLWALMRQHWSLPPERMFTRPGPEWLFTLLSQSDKSTRARILLLLWRTWHLRNDMIHGKGRATVAGSVEFLVNYANSLNMASGAIAVEQSIKGKEITDQGNLT
jgi:hypothetical protein